MHHLCNNTIRVEPFSPASALTCYREYQRYFTKMVKRALVGKLSVRNELCLVRLQYLVEDSMSVLLPVIEAGSASLNEAVSGHHHHYTPMHIPITGLVLQPAA
jgi:hypothetical protein